MSNSLLRRLFISKYTFVAISILVSGISILPSQANAATFGFSYSWADDAPIGPGSSISGTLTGNPDIDGNTILVTNLEMATWSNPTTGRSFDFTGNARFSQIATRDGSNMRIGGFSQGTLLPSFALVSDREAFVAESIGPSATPVRRANEQFDPSRWRIAEVPEPSEWIQGGLALLGCSFILFRKRSKSAR